MTKVKAGSFSGGQACYELLKTISLNDKGVLSSLNEESEEILRTLQRLHDSWFPRYNFNVSTQDYPNTDLYDANEMGYHFTYVLLKNEPVSHVLTQKRSFKGVRRSEKEHLYFIDRSIKGYRHLRLKDELNRWKVGGVEDKNDEEYQGPIQFWEPELVTFGRLIGLRPYKESKNRIRKWDGHKLSAPFDTHAPQGGGIIGSVPYLLLNAGQNERTIDGGAALHRRWSTAILKDLLCRNLPVLSQEDASSFVRSNSKISFRRKENCMSCHATIDPMAAVIRNMENYNSGNVDFHYTTRNVYWHQTHSIHKGDLPDKDLDFRKTRPDGRITMRDFHGKLIDKKVTGLAELGKELSQIDDFYACTAKRYLEFFTGRQITLESYQDLNEREKFAFDKLILNLKKHQSLKILIRDIFQSDFFLGDLNG